MAFTFPSSPSLNQTYTYNSVIWTYNGKGWTKPSSSATVTTISDQANTSTGYFDLPAGTTAQRPGTANTGMVRYNSTLSIVETYNGTSWTGLGGGETMSSFLLMGA